MTLITTIAPYSDDSGNSIKLEGGVKFARSEINFTGTSGRVLLGRDVDISDCKITVGGSSTLEIGDGTRLSGVIHVGFKSTVSLGKGVYVTKNIKLRAVEETSIRIGDGCLFGSDVAIRTADGHPIYDAKSRVRINTARSVEIGRHVWIADEVLILKGAKLEDACVAGARSVITKPVPRNCAVAGNPARVIKKDITWERSPGITNEDFYLDPDVIEKAMPLRHRFIEAIASSIRRIRLRWYAASTAKHSS